jgi:poly(3-hydroxybutyrate) depolymerase
MVLVTALGTSGASARPGGTGPNGGAGTSPSAATGPSPRGGAGAAAGAAEGALPCTKSICGELEAAGPPPNVVRLAPGKDGHLGAWLLSGPYRSAANVPKGTKPAPVDSLAVAPAGFDESKVAPTLSRGAAAGPQRWTIASTSDMFIDLARTLSTRETEMIAYAAGTLHVAKGGRHYFLVGVDDGIRIQVDGKTVFTRDEPRPAREDDDRVPVELTAGEHAITMKLHQRDGGWALSFRVVDETFAPPAGAYLTLPGTTLDDARVLAQKMSLLSFDRGVKGDGYFPKLTVRFPQGTPLGVPLPVRAKLPPFLDVSAGIVSPEAGEMVVALPPLRPDELKFEDQELIYETSVGERILKTPFSPKKSVREAIAHADRALAALPKEAPSWLLRGTVESVTHLRDRLATFASKGDGDVEAQRDEVRELEAAATALEKQVDPYAARTGPQRRAYRSPLDGRLAEYGLYVPPSYKPGTKRSYPLIVALHGLNGKPMAMLRYVFGGDDPKREHDWEDRHWSNALPPLEAFVITPNGHGNTMYRLLGLDDPMRVLDEITALYPIDATKVTVTGPSMGGIGSAALALRHPDRFAAAAPLCGYHSYFVRRDTAGKPWRPWERAIAEERSNALWAYNGKELPLLVVHGTMDLPEANSGVLIERYEALKYPIVHEHPQLGHNVWQTTYENLKGANWLTAKSRNLHPTHIRFRTMRLREDKMAWLRIREFERPMVWGEVEADVKSKTAVELTTKEIGELSLERDEKVFDGKEPITVTVDRTALTFAPADPLVMHKEQGRWKAGAAEHPGLWKKGTVTGPLRDAFHEPLLFVYGADDPLQARANEAVAKAWAKIGYGVDIHYPVVSDAEFLAKGEPLANDRALFLVGNARSNKVVRALEPELPIRVEGEAIVAAGRTMTGPELGAAFIRPNPKRTDRYVVVVEGVNALGTMRSLSLPDLIPDFVVYDSRVAPARGQVLLSGASVLMGGVFQNDWSFPSVVDDPLAKSARPMAKNEHDATPYLP